MKKTKLIVTKQDSIFQKKLLSNQIFPLILFEYSELAHVIPLIHSTVSHNNIYIGEEIQNQLIEYASILKRQEGYVVLFDNSEKKGQKTQKNKYEKQIGVLASFKITLYQDSIEKPLSQHLGIIPEKMVTISAIQKQGYENGYGTLVDTFFCEVKDLEYIVDDPENLKILIIKCLRLFRELGKISAKSAISFNEDMAYNIDYAVNISNCLIDRIRYPVKRCTDLLKINNLERRFETIESELVVLLQDEKKLALEKIRKQANESIKEVSEIPQGFSFVLFKCEMAKYLSLFVSTEKFLTSYSIAEAEQIELNYYCNNNSILLVEGTPEDFSPKINIVPSVLAKVKNVRITEENRTDIYITPERRVRITEIILKDGMFYGRAEEIVEPKLDNIEESNKLRKLVEQLITLFYQHSNTCYDTIIPIFNEVFANFETYATSISYHIAERTLGYKYNSYEKNVSREFCSKSTIEKLSYLIECIKSSNKASSAATTSNSVDPSTFTTSKQWLELGKSRIQTDAQEALSHFNEATQLDPSNAEAWYFKAKYLDGINKPNETLKCFEKILLLSLDNIYRYKALTYVIPRKVWLKEYEKALGYNSELLKLERSIFNLKVQARLYSCLEKYQEALKCCDEIAVLDNSDDSMFSFKGDILFELGRLEEAAECYGQAIELKRDDQYGIVNRETIALQRGITLDSLGMKEGANLEYEKVIKNLNIELAKFLHPAGINYFVKAMACSKLGNLKTANECYDKIAGRLHYFLRDNNYKLLKSYYKIVDLSDNKNAYFIKVDINEILQDYPEQIKCYERILELDPNNLTVLHELGEAYDKLDKTEEAVNCFEQLINLTSNNYNKSRLFNNIGKMLCKLGRYQETLEYFDKVFVIDTNTTDIICKVDTLAYYAYTLSKLEKHQQSIEYFDKALALDPHHTFSYLNKAKALNQLEKYQETLECCEKGLSINPDDPDLLVVRSTALHEECKLVLVEDPTDLEYLIQNIPLSSVAKNIALKEVSIIKSLNDSNNEKGDHMKYLHNILKLPWNKCDDMNIDLKKAGEVLDQEHYGLEEVKNRILESLIFMTRSNLAKTPIICLVGPPGVGKTSICRSIANALRRKLVSLSLAGGKDSSLIRGCMKFYRDSHPGKILSLMTEAGSSNPVLVLDEIDKVDHRGNGLELALLQLLDTEQNNRFTDDYFDFPFDLSKVFFITTANSLEQVSYPLINRMEIIELSGYTDEEKLQITNNYLIPKLLKEGNLQTEQFTMDDIIIKQLIKHYTKESGVRDIERILRIIIQKYLLDEVRGNKPIINLALIEQYLGTAKYQDTNPDKTAKVGMAIGLAYTASGGSTMTVEVEKFPGEGKVQATGKLGEVLKESVEAALSYLKANAQELAIEQQLFKKYDLHLHLPEGAIAKDGPSAGITIYVALASLLSGKKVKQDIAMTGELTLKGRVLPIGGLKEKLSAAVRENITTVIIPEGNKRDLAKIPHEIKGVLTIKTISHASELLNIVFVDEK